ncbi:MAG: hypothetical protein Q9221_003242 [Calogaya cf. arnoldii]
MRPLRLQIVVQPRVLSSPANPAPSEPIIKWLEVCTGNPTIQELSETLEKRFLQRNHTALNIKILKFLDDVELFPDYKVRDIFDDIRDVKSGDRDSSIVKVYRNPPTSVELADPRRFDSLPPDSFARPIKRPPSPYLRPPPFPLFADAVRDEAHNSFHRRDPQSSQFEDHTQAPNKRRKIQIYGSNPYTNHPDQAIDSRELADHDYMYSHTARQPPSQEPQVKDSQPSPRKKRKSIAALLSRSLLKRDSGSDPHGTPLSSQISQLEDGRTRQAGVVSVPDSPPDRIIDHGHESAGNSDSRSGSPELPSSLGLSSQLPEASTKVQPSNLLQQPRHSHQTIVESQTRPSARLPVNRKKVAPPRKPDFWSELDEAELDRRLEPPETAQTASRMTRPTIPSKGPTVSRSDSASQALPLLQNSERLPCKADSDTEKVGRLKRPNVAKSALALQGTSKVINGIRQKAPSITGIFDPIETSEGSSYEQQLPRSLKRARTNIPKKNARRKAPQNAASKNSLIVRLRVPNVTQPSSSAVSPPEVSRDGMMVNAHGIPNTAPTQELESQAAKGEVQNGSIETLYLAATDDPADQGSRSSNVTASSNEQVQSTRKHAKLGPGSSSPGIAIQTDSTVPPVQEPLILPDEHAVGTVGSSYTLEETMGDESIGRQVKEAAEIKEKAQAEFDRITALQKKRQSLQDSKIGPLAADSPVKLAVIEEPISSAVALSDEAKRIYSSDDLEAKRKYGLKQLASTRNKYFKDNVAIDSFRADLHVDEMKEQRKGSKLKISESQAEAKNKRQAKEQKDKEARMAIAKRIEEEKHSGGAQEKSERAKIVSGQETPASKQKTKDVKPIQQREVKLNQATYTKRASEGQSSQEAPEQAPETRRKEDNLLVEVEAEAAKAKRDEAKLMVYTKGTTPDSGPSKLAERSPKARLNAQRQFQIANEALKHSNNDFATVKTPAATATSKIAKSTSRAPKTQQNTSAKQAVKKSRGDTQKPNGQRRSEARILTHPVDDAALRAARAAGLSVTAKSTTAASKGSDTAAARIGTPKAISIDIAADGTPKPTKEPSRRSSSSSTTRNEPSRARTMTPAIPNSFMQSFPGSAEARARRAASASVKNMDTPTRNNSQAKVIASARSVSFAEEPLISQLHNNSKTSDQKSTPTPSDQSSRMSKVGKTPERTKQTTITQHVDRKLKGKLIDPPSPIRAPVEKEIIISSESEASTFYSDESERTRNARTGPSSRKKSKPRTSSSMSASNVADSDSGVPYQTTTMTNTHATKHSSSGSSGAPNQPASQPVKTPSKVAVQSNGTKSRRSDTHSDAESDSQFSRPTSAASTDDVSNLPPIVGVRQERPESLNRGKHDHIPRTSTPSDEDDSDSALEVRDEERLQLEANEQLQREHSQAMETKTTTDLQPSKVESLGTVKEQSRQTTQPTIRTEHKKYGSRVRINPTYENVSLSQLMKAQASEPMSMNGNAKRGPSPKSIDQSTVESSSASDSEDSSSSGSVDMFKKAPDAGSNSTPQKKCVLPSIWKDLYGREASAQKYQ